MFQAGVGMTTASSEEPSKGIIDIQQVEKTEGRKQTESLLKKVLTLKLG